MAAPYVYPVPNSQLIAAHALQAHFEGGYFAQTVAVSSVPTPSSPSPSSTPALSTAASSAEPSRTSSPTGTAMTAASSSTATLENRALVPSGPAAALLVPAAAKEPAPMYADATQIYYLLTPGSYRGRMHMNLHATFHVHHAGRAVYTLIRPIPGSRTGPEVRRVTVGSDVAAGEVTQLFVPGGWWKASEIPEADLALGDGENVGCLISEVVVPGWNPEQHQFIDLDKLKAMWNGEGGWEPYEKYIAPPAGLSYPDKE